MIWKGIGVLGGTAALIILGVVGLARLSIPDELTFEETLEEASESGVETADFVPTAVGGELEITGAVEGTIVLERQVDGPTYGLGNSQSRVFFESDPLAISQMSHEGLAFFPEPDDCEFTEGQQNQDLGLVGVQISCPELVDIRDNGTVTLEGFAALPANLVLTLDIPDTGGTITVGNEEWQINPESALLVGSAFPGSEPGIILSAEDVGQSLFLSYDAESDTLRPAWITTDGEDMTDMSTADCSVTDEELMVINPQAQIHEMTIDCEPVEVPGMGAVPIEGSVVYEKIFIEDDH